MNGEERGFAIQMIKKIAQLHDQLIDVMEKSNECYSLQVNWAH